MLRILLFGIAIAISAPSVPAADRPNVLFIAVDDLNDWIGCLGGHPQSVTPNFDRLAASGVLFTNAHCPAASCNPSRTAIMTGRSPARTGLYRNGQNMRKILPDETILPKHFSDHGYRAIGSGKILHYFIDAPSWDDYFPEAESENPFPRTLYPEKRPVSLPRGGPWQYVETDWGGLDATDEEFGGDYLVSRWVADQLGQSHEKPFFLACGLYRPHEPWFVPQKYFDQFPPDTIQLPPGYREDDLDDLPAEAKRLGPNRYFAHIRKHGQWKAGVRGYLASIAFADAMLGRVLDALESGPNKDNTVVVLWSDHGWHLGEKQHWQKFTGWRACTRVPLMVRVPAGTPGLPAGTVAGGACDRPVSLLSLFPTLTELCGIPPKPGIDGVSLRPLLADPSAEWSHVATTFLDKPGSVGISGEDWRYIRYADGGEELYRISDDPFEWHNLAGDADHAEVRDRLRAQVAETFAPLAIVEPAAPADLAFVPGASPPPSRPKGKSKPMTVVNGRPTPVELHWVAPDGSLKLYGEIAPGKSRQQSTRTGAVWAIGSPGSTILGHFVVSGAEAVRGTVPPE